MGVLTTISLGGLAVAFAAYLYARLGGFIVTVQAKPDPVPDESELARRRRRAAKLFNERLKLIAAFLNTLGIAGFITMIVTPNVNGSDANALPSIAVGFASLLVIQIFAHVVLSAWKSEE